MSEQCGSCAASRAEAAMWQMRYVQIHSLMAGIGAFTQAELDRPTMPRRTALQRVAFHAQFAMEEDGR